MDRRRFLLTWLAGSVAAPLTVNAQQAGKLARIGYLLLPPLAEKPSVERQAFLQGLRELGYEEGRHFVIEYRSAAWNRELLADLAEDLVERKVDVIVTAGPLPTIAARDATKTIPIVMVAGIAPVESGLVVSLARPGINVTGFVAKLPGLAGKTLELLREMAPHASHIFVIWNPDNPAAATDWKETQVTASAAGIKLESLAVRGADDFVAALPKTLARRPAAVVVIDDTLTVAYREIVAEFTLKNRVPAIMARREFAEAGGLMSYAPRFSDLFGRAARHVDRILKGAKASDLPIEQPTTFELVINLKTAKTLGLTIPPSLLVRADQVIE